MDTGLLPNHLAVLIGMAIVGIVSANMFNSWTKEKAEKYGYTDPPRHYTTFMRFNFYRTVYIAFMLAGYLILLTCPDVMAMLGIEISEEMARKIADQSYLWAALIITGVIPNFPVIQTWEARLRDRLQDYAFIPFEAQRIISVLEDDYQSFRPGKEARLMVIEAIGKEKNSDADFTNNRMDSLRHKWCKLSYLHFMIEALTIGGFSALSGFLILIVLERFDLPSILYVVTTAGLIGWGLGYTFIEEYRIHMRPEKERRTEARYAVSENVSLVVDDTVIDCQVVSISPTYATVNVDLPRSKTSARLKLGSLGDIPVIISRRATQQTVLQLLLDAIAKKNLSEYLEKVKETRMAGIGVAGT